MHPRPSGLCFFFFNDTATPEIYPLSLHDALPIWRADAGEALGKSCVDSRSAPRRTSTAPSPRPGAVEVRRGAERESRSEEHTSELQSPCNLVCRLLLEKKKQGPILHTQPNQYRLV